MKNIYQNSKLIKKQTKKTYKIKKIIDLFFMRDKK
jgi:hypothetical protein